ncbi:MAG: hypothetical protein KAW56_16935 [Candidatus Marinimicrobia bacterium]|nr:hypothetical protein [Candidatus Neomarinimicrobiota bacterium]
MKFPYFLIVGEITDRCNIYYFTETVAIIYCFDAKRRKIRLVAKRVKRLG